MSSVVTSRRKPVKDEILTRRVPDNPRYKNVKSVIDTGATLKKCPAQKIRDAIKKQDEVFKRIKLSTFVSLMVEVSKEEAGYTPKPACPTQAINTPSKEQLLPSLHSVIHGIGELDLKDKPTHCDQSTIMNKLPAHPYLLLDVRDPELYQQCHITTAKNYPSSMLCRTCNYETKDLLSYKNVPLNIIVIYDEDEIISSRVAATLTQRGYDNIFMLSGGLKLAASKFPNGLIFGTLPESCRSQDSKSNTRTAFRSTPVLTGAVKINTENKFTEDDLNKLQLGLHQLYYTSSSGTNGQSTVYSRATTARSVASRVTTGRTRPWK